MWAQAVSLAHALTLCTLTLSTPRSYHILGFRDILSNPHRPLNGGVIITTQRQGYQNSRKAGPSCPHRFRVGLDDPSRDDSPGLGIPGLWQKHLCCFNEVTPNLFPG